MPTCAAFESQRLRALQRDPRGDLRRMYLYAKRMRSEMARDRIHSIIGPFEPNLWNNRFPIRSTGTLLSIMRHRDGQNL